MLDIDNLREHQFNCFEQTYLKLIDGYRLTNNVIYPDRTHYEITNTKLGEIICFSVAENNIYYGYNFKDILITYCDIPTKKLKEFLQLMTIKHINSKYIVC